MANAHTTKKLGLKSGALGGKQLLPLIRHPPCLFFYILKKKDTRHVTHMYSQYVFDTIIHNNLFLIQIFPKGRSKKGTAKKIRIVDAR